MGRAECGVHSGSLVRLRRRAWSVKGPLWCVASAEVSRWWVKVVLEHRVVARTSPCDGAATRRLGLGSASRLGPRSAGSAAGSVEGVEVLGVGVGEGVEVLLGGGDLGVAHPVHHGLEVGSAGEQSGGVGVTQVVDADLEVHSRGGDDLGWLLRNLSGYLRDDARTRSALESRQARTVNGSHHY